MSRIGNAPVALPQGVKVTLRDGKIEVEGPKGRLLTPLPQAIELKEEGDLLRLARGDDSRASRALHGTTRALLHNSIQGVTKGWERRLELAGVGYRVQKRQSSLVFSIGYSHEVEYAPLPGVDAEIVDQTKIKLTSIDKQQLGQVASEIRSLRPPEPYKGKGIRYAGEVVRRKAGKTGKAAKK